MTFQNITIAKPSHLYLAAKPYLDHAVASINPYLAAWKPQHEALHTQWQSLNNRLFILNAHLVIKFTPAKSNKKISVVK